MDTALRSLLFTLAAGLAIGCTPSVHEGSQTGGSASTTANGGGGAGGGSTSSTTDTTGNGGTEPGSSTLKAQAGPYTIGSGEEAVKCITVDLGNQDSVIVRRFRTTLNEGSHHMIVYKSDQPPNPTPFTCQSFSVAGGQAIFIAQQPQSELVFPTDPSGTPVGLVLAPHQTLTLEVHYINPTGAPLGVIGTVELDVLPATANIIPSGFAFQGNLSIPSIPPHGEADTGVVFQGMVPGTHLFALTTHQHHLGTRMQVWKATDVNNLGAPVADSTSWSDPPLVMFDPPLDFPADGSQGLAYDCHWKNPTDQTVNGGLSANDEMCFFWSYFYPAL